MIRKNKVLTDKLQVDTVAGILYSLILLVVLLIGIDSLTLHYAYNYLLLTTSIILFTVAVDMFQLKIKLLYLDTLLYFINSFYFFKIFGNVFSRFSTISSIHYANVTKDMRGFEGLIEITEHFNSVQYKIDPYLSAYVFLFISFIVVTLYTTYGFFSRFISSTKHITERANIESMLANLTNVSTIDLRKQNLGEIARINMIQETNPRELFTERANENQQIEENAKHKRAK